MTRLSLGMNETRSFFATAAVVAKKSHFQRSQSSELQDDIEGNDLATMTFARRIDSAEGAKLRLAFLNEPNHTNETDENRTETTEDPPRQNSILHRLMQG